MKGYKRIISMALAFSLALYGVGCEKNSDSGNSDVVSGNITDKIFSGDLERNVRINILENDTAIEKGYLAELIAAFNEEYKDYGIVAVDANMDQYLDLANDGPYGYGPDVLYQANDMLMKYVEGKHIYPLPVQRLDCYQQIPQSAWDAYKSEMDGSEYICGVPVNVQAPMLYYRKDLLPENWETNWDDDKNGIPDMVENFNDMYRYSNELKLSGKQGFMFSIYEVYFSAGFLFSYGGYVFGDNNKDSQDIGFNNGEAYKGARLLKKLAGIMNEETIDDTITRNAYGKLGDGSYFAVISTPDNYTTFIDEMKLNYQKQGLSEDEAKAKAEENLVITSIPLLPEDGDITNDNSKMVEYKAMGGINGYAISAYTKAPNAALAFVDFATSYEMVKLRSDFLGLAAAREDVAKETGGLSEMLYTKLSNGYIDIMPSIRAVSQIWTPCQTFLSDLAKDAFRPEDEQKFLTDDDFKKGLETVNKQIYDAIYTLNSSESKG